MKITHVRGVNDCPDVVRCPSIDLIDQHPDRVYFIGKQETDSEVLAAFAGRLGPDEGLFWQPAEMHPDITR